MREPTVRQPTHLDCILFIYCGPEAINKQCKCENNTDMNSQKHDVFESHARRLSSHQFADIITVHPKQFILYLSVSKHRLYHAKATLGMEHYEQFIALWQGG